MRYIECSASKQYWIKSGKKVYYITTNMLMSQMHFWLVDCIHKILITFVAEVVWKIFSSRKSRRKKRRFRDRKTFFYTLDGDENRTNPKAILSYLQMKSSFWINCLWLFSVQRVVLFCSCRQTFRLDITTKNQIRYKWFWFKRTM